MKKLIKYTATLVFSLCILDLIIGTLGSICRKHLPTTENQTCKINNIINTLNSDVVIIGSSTASRHYKTSIIQKSFKDLTIYNAGIDGLFLEYQYCFIKCLLARETTKLIIWDVSDRCFQIAAQNPTSLNPYYQENEIIKNFLDKYGIKEQIKLMSNMYRHNSLILSYCNSLMSKDDNSDGYFPLYESMTQEESLKLLSQNKTKEQKDSTKHNIELLTDIFSECKQKDVHLIVVGSPLYGAKENNNFVMNLCKRDSIPFIDLVSSPYIITRPELFKDLEHMNDKGASLFSEMLCDSLEIILSN